MLLPYWKFSLNENFNFKFSFKWSKWKQENACVSINDYEALIVIDSNKDWLILKAHIFLLFFYYEINPSLCTTRLLVQLKCLFGNRG